MTATKFVINITALDAVLEKFQDVIILKKFSSKTFEKRLSCGCCFFEAFLPEAVALRIECDISRTQLKKLFPKGMVRGVEKIELFNPKEPPNCILTLGCSNNFEQFK